MKEGSFEDNSVFQDHEIRATKGNLYKREGVNKLN